MKKILFFSFFSLCFILLGGCNNNIGEESTHGSQVNQLDGVSIELTKDTYSPKEDSFELITKNQSEEEVTYGVGYSIEYLKDNAWYTVRPSEEMSFILIAHILEPGGEVFETISMEYYEPLQTGDYRLLRQINDEILAAEFSVVD